MISHRLWRTDFCHEGYASAKTGREGNCVIVNKQCEPAQNGRWWTHWRNTLRTAVPSSTECKKKLFMKEAKWLKKRVTESRGRPEPLVSCRLSTSLSRNNKCHIYIHHILLPKLFPHPLRKWFLCFFIELADAIGIVWISQSAVCLLWVLLWLSKLTECWDYWLARQRSKFLPLVQISFNHGLVSGLSAVWQHRGQTGCSLTF